MPLEPKGPPNEKHAVQCRRRCCRPAGEKGARRINPKRPLPQNKKKGVPRHFVIWRAPVCARRCS